ncbi:bifunctional RNase H/acid phosphatase [Streptomyces sp. TP-A0356]|uniref:bifunctional RNase H/acid phosphatase n=1 Tax=Streptomyces sp. TP-A0356 TaxID=1359208 RepID=UPI0006E3E228|nr:bifunctional RNase H/acid phosphatase [Streptomyces sp. TP-A0356]
MREFIVEADGGSRGNPGPAGHGSVVRDAATGETLVERAEFIGVATNNVAEYRGLLAGLRAAHELDPAARVRVRMDSKLVVEQMSGRWKIKHPAMRPLAMQAAAVFPAEQVTYEWIPRESNKHADRLANEAMDAGGRGERWEPSGSTAEPDTGGATAREPVGTPGDATVGAARVRAAVADAATRSPAGDGAMTGGVPTVERSCGGAMTGGVPTVERSGGGAMTGGVPTVERSGGGAMAGGVPTVERSGGGAMAGGVPTVERSGGGAMAADVRAARNVASAPPDLGAPTTFVLLRHGETPLTPLKRFSGSGGSDPALSDAGRRQAGLVAGALAARGTIQAVVSSPLVRCRQTAAIAAARLGLDVSVEDGLRETDFGAWEGLTFGEVRERYPDDMDAWLADPEAEPTGGGESFAAVARRVAAARDKLITSYAGRTVLLVSHVTPIKTLVRLALDAPPHALFRMELSAASLTVVAYYADGNAGLRLLNDTSHLR